MARRAELRNVTIGPSGTLDVEGADSHEQEAGLLRLRGSGAVRAGADLSLRRGTWRNDGDLLLEGPLDLGQSSQWTLDNRGMLRVGGVGVVTLTDGTLDNHGSIDVEQGALHISYGITVRQRRIGSVNLAADTTLSADEQLVLPGSVSGFGRVACDLEATGMLQPGSSAAHGTLTIGGALQMGPRSKITIRVEDTGHYSRVVSTGQIFLAGSLDVDGGGYTPAIGDSLDIVSGAAGSHLAGRLAAANLPAPQNGNYLYLTYAGHAARLCGGTSTPGFDMAHPPPTNVLLAWVAASPYRWVGYYLQSPCHGRGSWNGLRPILNGSGLGILVIYVGQQSPGTSPCTANNTTSAQGSIDAADAIARATNEGFPAQTWIYLDIERSAIGGQPTHGMLSYVQAWVDYVLTDGTYNPGIYAYQADVPGLDATVTAAFQDHHRTDRTRYWVVGGPATGTLADAPWRSRVPEAVCWQQRLDFNETRAGHTLRIDRSVSYRLDPSAP